jgi:hypothetical protein
MSDVLETEDKIQDGIKTSTEALRIRKMSSPGRAWCKLSKSSCLACTEHSVLARDQGGGM